MTNSDEADYKRAICTLAAVYLKVEAERDALRAALEQIAKRNTFGWPQAGLDGYVAAWDECASIARAALQAQVAGLKAELDTSYKWICSLLVHLEDHWRAIDEGPIERARSYVTPARAALAGPTRTADQPTVPHIHHFIHFGHPKPSEYTPGLLAESKCECGVELCFPTKRATVPTVLRTENPGQIGECSECGAAYYNESDIGLPCQIRHCRGRVVRNRKQGGEQT